MEYRRFGATCEPTLTCIDGHAGREHQASTGLNLFRFD